MKKIYFIIVPLFFLFLFSLNVRAANNQGTENQGSGSAVNQGAQGSEIQPIQNQNQVQTQNQGEETQLRVQEEEKQGVETGKGLNSNSPNENSQVRGNGVNDSMSSVARQIRLMLSSSSAEGGIGEQVRQWAREQNSYQENIQKHVENIENRSALAKAIMGPNYGAINSLRKEMEQNRVRVQNLEELENSLTNEGEITNVQEMIQLIQQENTALQNMIVDEEASSGLFGWLFRVILK